MNSPNQATYYAEATERGPLDPRLTDYIYEAVTIDEHTPSTTSTTPSS